MKLWSKILNKVIFHSSRDFLFKVLKIVLELMSYEHITRIISFLLKSFWIMHFYERFKCQYDLTNSRIMKINFDCFVVIQKLIA